MISRRLDTTGVRPLSIAAFVLALLLSLSGCDPLGVESPDIVQPDDLTGEAGLNALLNGARADFAVAYGGSARGTGEQGIVATSGLLADEIVHSGTQNDRVQLDARRAEDRNERSLQTYRSLQRAREAAESAVDRFAASEELSADAKSRGLAELRSLAGYSYVFFGEAYCSGVPISSVSGGEITFGSPQTSDELFQSAASKFSTAAQDAESAGADNLSNLAMVGRGRALLNLGRYQEAAEAVSGVPVEFNYDIRFSGNSDRQANGITAAINEFERLSTVNAEGDEGVDYLAAHTNGDPRTPFEKDPDDGVGFDSSVELFLQLKYPGRDSPIPVASGVEARLIEAEAALQRGAMGEFETIHNSLRARLGTDAVGSIETDTMSREEAITFHFRERALWFWLTAHRLGDMRRLVEQYGRSVEDVYPSGPYFKPQYNEYGQAVTLIVPFQERNNPNFNGCIDRGV